MVSAPRTLPRLLLILLLLTAVFAALQLYPADLPSPLGDRRGDLLATILYDQAIVFVLRVVVLCAAVFTVLSIVGRIRNREWLMRAGPFEVERTAERADRERDDLKAQLTQLQAEYDRLVEPTRWSRTDGVPEDRSPRRRSHATQ